MIGPLWNIASQWQDKWQLQYIRHYVYCKCFWISLCSNCYYCSCSTMKSLLLCMIADVLTFLTKMFTCCYPDSNAFNLSWLETKDVPTDILHLSNHPRIKKKSLITFTLNLTIPHRLFWLWPFKSANLVQFGQCFKSASLVQSSGLVPTFHHKYFKIIKKLFIFLH